MNVLKATLVTLLTFAACTAFATRPNLIVVFTDDHGYSDLSCQGVFDDVRTPRIDSLAAGGVRMTITARTVQPLVPHQPTLLFVRT